MRQGTTDGAPVRFAAEFRGLLSGLALVGAAALLAIDGPLLIPGQELLQSLRFHIGAALLCLVALLFISRAWWRGVVMLVLVVGSLGQGGLIVYRQQEARQAFDGRTPAATARVLSFNVLASNERDEDIADYMIETAPDVIFTLESNAILPQLDRLATAFPFRAGCDSIGGNCDTMMFSRTPLTDVRVVPLEPFNRLRAVIAKTTIGGQEMTLLATHLSKPYFDEAAWVELWHLRQLLAGITGPVILAGDFNASAWSDLVAAFVADMNLVPPPRYPATWPIRFGQLGVPIDNMFTRGGARIEAIQAMPDALGSNHRGLLAKVGLYAPD